MRKTQERDKCSSIGIDHKLPCAGKLELWSRQRQPRMMAPLRMKVTRPAGEMRGLCRDLRKQFRRCGRPMPHLTDSWQRNGSGDFAPCEDLRRKRETRVSTTLLLTEPG
jgi:hypothetical protein